ncbi:MAG TPA: hypothetical protein VFX48_07135, partial [Saprospiraceae bacterium]|nr:hypothetical protein [Saprospiraceae bacterium]
MRSLFYLFVRTGIGLLIVLNGFIVFAQAVTLTPPPDLVLSCRFTISDSELYDPHSRVFGGIVLDSTQRKKVITNDIVCARACEKIPSIGYPGYQPQFPNDATSKYCDYYKSLFDSVHRDRSYDLVWGFDGFASEVVDIRTIRITDQRMCNQGRILRSFVAQTAAGDSLTATQTIWVIDCHPFYINVADLCDPDDNLDWPDCDKPFVIQNCSAIDSSLGPRIRSGACSQLFINYSDEVVPDVPGYCFQIRRNWEVIDWCQYNKNMIPNPGEWSFIQTLNVVDSLAPDLEIYG